MIDQEKAAGYRYNNGELNASHGYLLPAVEAELDRLGADLAHGQKRLFDIGCGNGSVGAALARRGWSVTGVDPSPEAIANTPAFHPKLKLELGSAYDDLATCYGRFPVVISLEVVEHLYDPHAFARKLYDLLEPGGTAIISTPYHGYWKNLLMALTGKLDAHFTALWHHGHIKFWSIRTLSALLAEASFLPPRYLRVGRVPLLAKSMIAIVQKPD